MEAKTLFGMIQDDITHLEGITGEFDLESLPSSEVVELALVRANALLKELELLHKFTVQHESSLKAIMSVEEPEVEVSEPGHSDHKPFELLEIETGDIAPTTGIENEETALPADQKIPDTKETTDVENEIASEISDYKEELLLEERNEENKTPDETPDESNQVVNDILSQGKSESGYQIIPINSIRDGIGINDRFLFVRELFENDSLKFETTVADLDKLVTIQDAVNYLKMNFKWHKSEASHKFLGLVKRRFTN